ncbi:MAG TPA: hypothetical protein VF132_06570, partial [Rudaea sp.]
MKWFCIFALASIALLPLRASAETDVYLSAVSGQDQSALAGHSLDEPFVVEVTDQHGTPLSGITVWFNIDYCVQASNASVCPGFNAYGKFGDKYDATVVSDRAGRAVSATFKAGSLPAQYTVHAVVPPQKLPNGVPVYPHGDPAYFQVTQTASSSPVYAAGVYYDPKRSGEGWELTFGTSNGQPTVLAT